MPDINLTQSDTAKDYAKKAAIGAGVGLAAGAAGLLIESLVEAQKMKQAQAQQKADAEAKAITDQKILEDYLLSNEPFIKYDTADLKEKQHLALALVKLYGDNYSEEHIREMIGFVNSGKLKDINLVYNTLIKNGRKVILEDRIEAKKQADEAEQQRQENRRKSRRAFIMCGLIVFAILVLPFIIVILGEAYDAFSQDPTHLERDAAVLHTSTPIASHPPTSTPSLTPSPITSVNHNNGNVEEEEEKNNQPTFQDGYNWAINMETTDLSLCDRLQSSQGDDFVNGCKKAIGGEKSSSLGNTTNASSNQKSCNEVVDMYKLYLRANFPSLYDGDKINPKLDYCRAKCEKDGVRDCE